MAMPIEQLDNLLNTEQEVEEYFHIDDLGAAIWADEKVRDAEMKLQEIDQLAEDRIAVLQTKIDKLNEWREEAKKPYVSKIEFFKNHLMGFLLKQAETGKKTVKLPFRDLVCRSQQPQIEKDDEQLLVWAKENASEFIEHKPSFKWGEFKKTLIATANGYVDANGEIVPHVKLIPRPDVLDWKVKQ